MSGCSSLTASSTTVKAFKNPYFDTRRALKRHQSSYHHFKPPKSFNRVSATFFRWKRFSCDAPPGDNIAYVLNHSANPIPCLQWNIPHSVVHFAYVQLLIIGVFESFSTSSVIPLKRIPKLCNIFIICKLAACKWLTSIRANIHFSSD